MTAQTEIDLHTLMQARCNIAAQGVGSGYYAQGSVGFVTGAAIGNAIGNAIQQDQFMRNCMVLQGWRRDDPQTASAKATARKRAEIAAGRNAATGPSGPLKKSNLIDTVALNYMAQTCSIKIKASGQEITRQAKSFLTSAEIAQARQKANAIMKQNTATASKAQACQKLRTILKGDVDWL